MANALQVALLKHVSELEKLPADKLRAARNERIAGFGVFSEASS
jgi:acetyl-CoA carboxylase alpha subunit